MESSNDHACALRVALIVLVTGGSLFAATWSEASTGLPGFVPGIIALTVDPMTPSTIYARSTGGAVFKSTDGSGSWRRLSSVAGVTSLVVDPTESTTLYASTDRGFFLKSTNGGETWAGSRSGPAAPFGMLAIDPATPSTLYAVSYLNGVYKSADGGGSWKVLGNAPSNTFQIVVDPSNPSTVYAPGETGAFQSTDGGENWSVLAAGLPANMPVTALAIDPTDSSTMYLAYLDRVARGGVIIMSADGGRSWTPVEVGIAPRASIRSIVVHPVSRSIYVTFQINSGVGFTRSSDGGATWQAIHEDLPPGNLVRSLAIDPADPATIYVAYHNARTTSGGLVKSTSGGASWNQADDGLMEIDIRTLAADPANRATVYTGGSDGLFRSLDSGTTWANLMQFQLPAPNWAPPLSQPPPFGAEPAHTRAVLIHPANPSMIYALTWRYNACAFSDRLVFKSTDGGSTWSDHASPPFSGCRLSAMVLDPGNPETIYVAEAEDGAWLRKSADGGKNWNTVWDWTRGMESHLNALAIDPTNSAILYAGLSDFSQFLGSSTVSGLMKSVDGGATWSNLGLTGTAVTLLVVDPSDPSVIYASTEGLLSEPRGFRGLFKSTDSGVSWAAINDGLESLLDNRFRITDLVIDRDNPRHLYAGSGGGGVFTSTDGGGVWKPHNTGLANLDIRALALASGNPKTLYAGTASGVFKLVDEF
jgi:photosystem II stability/assembly factor-like uncharacterized protein